MRWRVSGATAALCLCALTHAFIILSFFPYAGYMAVFLSKSATRTPTATDDGEPEPDPEPNPAPRLSVETAGLWAGLLSTAFTAGRAAGLVPWRRASDLLGRRPALLLSLALSALFSVLFGMSTTLASATAARFALGLSNGISGAVKSAARDRARRRGDGDDEDERAAARVLGMMSWGFLIGPAAGGLLSDPISTSSASRLVRYPFLLPNLVGAALCAASMAAVWACVEEEEGGGEAPPGGARPAGWRGSFAALRLRRAGGGEGEARGLLADAEAGGPSREDGPRGGCSGGGPRPPRAPLAPIWRSRDTRRHLISYWAFSFAVVCVDEAFPLFCISRAGGPGLSEAGVGAVLSGAGLLFALCQYATFSNLVDRVGLYPSLRLGAALGNPPAALVPLSLLLNRGTAAAPAATGGGGGGAFGLTWPAYAFLVLLLGSLKVFASLFFAAVSAAADRTVPPSHLESTRSLLTLGALAARAVAPTFAGGLVSFSLSTGLWEPRFGSVAIWSVIGLALGVAAAAQAFALSDAASWGRGRKTSGARVSLDSSDHRRLGYLSDRQRAQLHVNLWQVHYDRVSDSAGAKWRRGVRKVIALNRFRKSHSVVGSDPINARAHAPIKKLKSWDDYSFRVGANVDDLPFLILGTHGNDDACKPHVLSPPLMEALHRHLPPEENFWLKFSLVRDGSSLHSLEQRIVWSKHTVLAIETLDGEVFGSYTSAPWQRTNHYFGGGRSFLWRMKHRRSAAQSRSPMEQAELEGDIEVHPWTGQNELCQLLTHNRIAVGGGLIGGGGGDGFGLMVEDDLMRGSSAPCVTYGNPCLCPYAPDGVFEVANIEVWAMTPFLFEADAERSERSVGFVAENAVSNFL